MANQDIYIGLMSGTSVDALDAALVDFSADSPFILGTHLHKIPPVVKEHILSLSLPGQNEIFRLAELDKIIAEISCQAIKELCEKSDYKPSQIRAIGSHGQTIRHYPKSTDKDGYSLQIGDPNIIAEHTGITTVADFRRRDIAAGGQGAPLAPAFHRAAFYSEANSRIILNTGGIANITYLHTTEDTIGYDTGPANGLMDSWCQRHTGKAYDNNGLWACNGSVDQQLLNQLLSHPYFTQQPPKSTGKETFNLGWLEEQLEKISHPITPEDVQATLLVLTVESISQSIEITDKKAACEIYICGGGAHNSALCSALETRLSPRKFNTTEALGIHPDWVEAVAFAWLAKQTLENRPGNLPSVTGAHKAVVLGAIYPGR